jgi:predicted cobalt transporter CbtA
MSIRSLLVRGMLVGVAAGAVAYLFATLFGESSVDQAIAFESAHAAAEHGGDEPELVSRAVQSTIGLATAAGVYGVAFGGLFALAFAFAYGRLGRIGARTTAALLALGGFVTVGVVPFLVYPPNPPATGNADTIGKRTALYFLLVVIAVGTALVALYAGRRLAPRLGRWNATLVAAGGFLVFLALVATVLPDITEVPEGFPATTLWQFRLASLGTQLATWTTIGLLFGGLTQRSLDPARTAVRAKVSEQV